MIQSPYEGKLKHLRGHIHYNVALNQYQIKKVEFQPAQYSDYIKYKAGNNQQPGISQLFQKISANIFVSS